MWSTNDVIYHPQTLMVPNQVFANMREEGFINVPVIDIEFVMPSFESLDHVSHIIFHTFHTANIFHKICVKTCTNWSTTELTCTTWIWAWYKNVDTHRKWP